MNTTTSTRSITPNELALIGQLRGIKEVINRHPDFNDTMTKAIKVWHHNFSQAPNVTEAKETYLPLMTQILTDPFMRNKAPILDAALGSDGITYEYRVIKINQWLSPDPYNKRSPIRRDIDTPFTFKRHPIAQHLISWLRDQGALRFSRSVEEAFRRHQPRDFDVDRELEAELDQIEAEKRMEHLDRFDAYLDRRVAQLQKMLGGIDPSEAENKEREKITAVTQTVSNALARQDDALNASRERLKKAQESTTQKFAAITNQIKAAGQRNQAAAARFAQQSSRSRQIIQSLPEKVAQFQQQTSAQFADFATKQRQALETVKQEICETTTRIASLTARNQQIDHELKRVSTQIDRVKEEQLQVEQQIVQTQIAIEEKKENESLELVMAVAIIGACALGTWWLQAAAPGMGAASASIAPSQGGATLSITIPIG